MVFKTDTLDAANTTIEPPAPSSPKKQMEFAVVLEKPFAVSGKEGTILADLHLNAPEEEVEENAQRAPLRISAVLDRSGSMQGGKLELVKMSMEFVLQQLKENDKFGIVSYDSTVREDTKLEKLTAPNMRRAQDAIHNLVAGSCTNLSGGLLKGLEQLASDIGDESQATVDAIWLFTDGLANEGITDISKLREAMREVVAKVKSRVQVHCFGFGNDHNADFMRAIAETTGGMYYYVDVEENIPTSFAQALGGLASVFAQNIDVVAEIEGDGQITKCHTSYPSVLAADGKNLTINLADMYAGEARDIMLSLKIQPTAVPVTIKSTVRYLNVITMNKETFTTSILIDRPEKEPESPPPVPEILALQRDRIRVAEAVEEARRNAEAGRFREAQSIVQEARAELASESHADHMYSRALQSDLNHLMGGFGSASAYRSYGSKVANQTSMEHRTQRGGADWEGRVTTYTNAKQKHMKSATPFATTTASPSPPSPPSPQPSPPRNPGAVPAPDTHTSTGLFSALRNAFH